MGRTAPCLRNARVLDIASVAPDVARIPTAARGATPNGDSIGRPATRASSSRARSTDFSWPRTDCNGPIARGICLGRNGTPETGQPPRSAFGHPFWLGAPDATRVCGHLMSRPGGGETWGRTAAAELHSVVGSKAILHRAVPTVGRSAGPRANPRCHHRDHCGHRARERDLLRQSGRPLRRAMVRNSTNGTSLR